MKNNGKKRKSILRQRTAKQALEQTSVRAKQSLVQLRRQTPPYLDSRSARADNSHLFREPVGACRQLPILKRAVRRALSTAKVYMKPHPNPPLIEGFRKPTENPRQLPRLFNCISSKIQTVFIIKISACFLRYFPKPFSSKLSHYV